MSDTVSSGAVSSDTVSSDIVSTPTVPVAIVQQAFASNLDTIERNLAGIDDAMALFAGGAQPHSSVNWILGHLLVSRDRVHALLGLEPLLGEEVRAAYSYGTKPSDDPPLPATEQLALLRASTERIAEALRGADPGRELKGGSTLGTRLWGLSWHETYHVGQLGVLRRLLGLEGAI